jgi:hypothetical protein
MFMIIFMGTTLIIKNEQVVLRLIKNALIFTPFSHVQVAYSHSCHEFLCIIDITESINSMKN